MWHLSKWITQGKREREWEREREREREREKRVTDRQGLSCFTIETLKKKQNCLKKICPSTASVVLLYQ